ncbi:MAG TPA: hypothetical protein VNL71_13565 [Chloroflexota bacterium]|nr:hypothetical protein [Chloroflexota bacterium]
MPASLLCRRIDLGTPRRQSGRAKELGILLLRRQLALLPRTQARPMRPTGWETLGLAVLASNLRSLPADARTRVLVSVQRCTPAASPPARAGATPLPIVSAYAALPGAVRANPSARLPRPSPAP